MCTKKIYSFTTVCLIVLLLSGCNNALNKTAPSNQSPQNTSTLSSTEIANANFSFLGDKYVWIGLNIDIHDPLFTEILYSSDQGQTWSSSRLNNYHIITMQFIDREHGWAIGITDPQSAKRVYSILSTSDGGENWTKQFETEQVSRISPCQIQFLNANEGFAKLNNNLLYTTDSGQSWKQIFNMENLMSVDFENNKEGWASSTDSLWHTSDGGNTWNKEWSVPDNIRKTLEPVNSKVTINSTLEGWAQFSSESTMSQSSKIILHKDKSNSWTIESGYYMAEPPFSGKPAPFETGDLLPRSNTSAFFVAYLPSTYPIAVLKTNDQGKSWSKIMNESRPKGFPPMIAGDLARIDFVNEQLAWGVVVNRSASSNSLNIVRTEDGGAIWRVVMQK
ncbi:YCF48-related protein [Desulfosporosinus sp. SB140]|uniref:YCF48-related protein n=1 Tax=Desulfosporosinus paludis TaxID=3115649 RepID=UPI00388E6419